MRPYAQQVGLVFGDPAKATDQNAFAVTQEFADNLGVTTLSELADACGDGSLTLGGPGECPTRPQCQLGLQDTYGLTFAGFDEYDAGGPLTKAAIQQGDVSIGLGFVVTSMFFLGVVFGVLWATAYFLGQRIEIERAEWERTGRYPGAPTEG